MMADRTAVPMGATVVRRAPGVLSALGLGSCVAVVVCDAAAGIGGMAHVVLPAPPPVEARPRPGRYAQTAVPLLVEEMVAAGADRTHLVACLVGGAAMFTNLLAPGLIPLGERNTHAARTALRTAGVRVSGEWVGGDFGRSVTVDLGSARVEASSVRHGTRVL